MKRKALRKFQVISLMWMAVVAWPLMLKGGSCYIKGTIPLDSTWSPVIYVCEFASLSQWYLASDFLITDTMQISTRGTFAKKVILDSNDPVFIRFQIVQRSDPASTLYVGNKMENYIVLPVRSGDTIDLRAVHMPWLGLETTAPLYPEFATMKSFFDTLSVANKTSDRILEQISNWKKLRPEPLLIWYAAFQFANLFPDQLDRIKPMVADLPPGNYAFLDIRNPYHLSWWVILVGILLLGSGLYYFQAKTKLQDVDQRKIDSLTNQELRILQGIIGGKSNKELAAEMYVELSTIKSHINRIYQKLEINSRKDTRRFSSLLPGQSAQLP